MQLAQMWMVADPDPVLQTDAHCPTPDPDEVPFTLLTTHAACLWLAEFPEAEKVPV